MKRHLVIVAPIALALLAGGAFLVGGEQLAGAGHPKKVPSHVDRGAALKDAFVNLGHLENWVEHECHTDCAHAISHVRNLRADLEALRMHETTKWSYRPAAMSGPAFAALVRAVHDVDYDSRRVELLRAEARTSFFTTEQVRHFLSDMDYDSNRLVALEALASRIVDPENAIAVVSAFDYDSSRVRARSIVAASAGARGPLDIPGHYPTGGPGTRW